MADSIRDKLVVALASALIGILATAAVSLLLVGNQLHALDSKMDAMNLNLSTRLTAVETQLKQPSH